MKVIAIAAAIIGALVMLVQPVVAQDFQKGLEAVERGDYATALREFKALAEQGTAGAQIGLGLMYDNGRGVTQDDVQAHMWFNLAAAQGNENFSKNRGIVEKLMTTADISKVQRMARQWRPGQ